uniref:Uncharacterized protein n=1 Tax=Aegilops tauschii subsp. strangulata TaxID=200361 RepID=A0A453PCN4_AEGTS
AHVLVNPLSFPSPSHPPAQFKIQSSNANASAPPARPPVPRPASAPPPDASPPASRSTALRFRCAHKSPSGQQRHTTDFYHQSTPPIIISSN